MYIYYDESFHEQQIMSNENRLFNWILTYLERKK